MVYATTHASQDDVSLAVAVCNALGLMTNPDVSAPPASS